VSDFLYEVNGVPFWREADIILREQFIAVITRELQDVLADINPAWRWFRVEAPVLTPTDLLHEQYSSGDGVYRVNGVLALRPETTMGSYAYARYLLGPASKGIRLPIVVWQAGKSFRKEQDQPTKFVRLKEFWQAEYQMLYSPDTKCDYAERVIPRVAAILGAEVGPCEVVPSDRIPAYSERTVDVEHDGLELCSISQRTDFEGARNLEVAIGLDRCVVAYRKAGVM